MTSDPFPSEPAKDPMEGTATIAAVTSDMMDGAARKAAEAADLAAHASDIVVEATSDAIAEGAAVTKQAEADVASGVDPSESAVEAGTALVTEASRGVDDLNRQLVEANETALTEATAAANDAGAAVKAGVSDSAEVLARYNGKVLEIIQANMTATGDYLAALMSATSVPEAMALNADHLRRQMDAMTTQSRELATLAQKLAFGALQPLKATVASRFRDMP